MTDKRFELYYSNSKREWYIRDTLNQIKCFGCVDYDVANYICKEWNKLIREKDNWKYDSCNYMNLYSILDMDCQILMEAIWDLEKHTPDDDQLSGLVQDVKNKFNNLNNHRIGKFKELVVDNDAKNNPPENNKEERFTYTKGPLTDGWQIRDNGHIIQEVQIEVLANDLVRKMNSLNDEIQEWTTKYTDEMESHACTYRELDNIKSTLEACVKKDKGLTKSEIMEII